MLLQVERKVSLIIDRQGVNLNGGLILKSYLFGVGFEQAAVLRQLLLLREEKCCISFTKNIQQSTV